MTPIDRRNAILSWPSARIYGLSAQVFDGFNSTAFLDDLIPRASLGGEKTVTLLKPIEPRSEQSIVLIDYVPFTVCPKSNESMVIKKRSSTFTLSALNATLDIPFSITGCPPGWRRQESKDDLQCSPCSPGEYSFQINSSCADCPGSIRCMDLLEQDVTSPNVTIRIAKGFSLEKRLGSWKILACSSDACLERNCTLNSDSYSDVDGKWEINETMCTQGCSLGREKRKCSKCICKSADECFFFAGDVCEQCKPKPDIVDPEKEDNSLRNFVFYGSWVTLPIAALVLAAFHRRSRLVFPILALFALCFPVSEAMQSKVHQYIVLAILFIILTRRDDSTNPQRQFYFRMLVFFWQTSRILNEAFWESFSGWLANSWINSANALRKDFLVPFFMSGTCSRRRVFFFLNINTSDEAWEISEMFVEYSIPLTILIIWLIHRYAMRPFERLFNRCCCDTDELSDEALPLLEPNSPRVVPDLEAPVAKTSVNFKRSLTMILYIAFFDILGVALTVFDCVSEDDDSYREDKQWILCGGISNVFTRISVATFAVLGVAFSFFIYLILASYKGHALRPWIRDIVAPFKPDFTWVEIFWCLRRIAFVFVGSFGKRIVDVSTDGFYHILLVLVTISWYILVWFKRNPYVSVKFGVVDIVVTTLLFMSSITGAVFDNNGTPLRVVAFIVLVFQCFTILLLMGVVIFWPTPSSAEPETQSEAQDDEQSPSAPLLEAPVPSEAIILDEDSDAGFL